MIPPSFYAGLLSLHLYSIERLNIYPVLQSPRYDRPREQTLGRGHT